jgi:carboxymethylenebutenolidase
MKRLFMLGLVFLVGAGVVSAGEETVSYKSGDESVSSFFVAPEGKGPFPAVIVIQEWWGLNAWIKDQARALAKEGMPGGGSDVASRTGRRRPIS